MFKFLIAALLLFVLVVVGYQFYGTFENYSYFQQRFVELKTEVDLLEKENQNLQKEIRYLSKTENLIKELRNRFNYRLPGENLIIVAPPRDVNDSEL